VNGFTQPQLLCKPAVFPGAALVLGRATSANAAENPCIRNSMLIPEDLLDKQKLTGSNVEVILVRMRRLLLNA
jgi:hypothetical protein